MRSKTRKFRRVVGKSKKSKLDGRGQFNFVNTDDPNYKKPCGKTYSEKQLKLLTGEIPWETTPLQQLTVLLYKTEQLNDVAAYKTAKELRDLKLRQRDSSYKPDLTVEEAEDILRALTPWNI